MKTHTHRPSHSSVFNALIATAFATALAAVNPIAVAQTPVGAPKIPSGPIDAEKLKVPELKPMSIKIVPETESALSCAKLGGGAASITIKLTNDGGVTIPQQAATIDVVLSVAGGGNVQMVLTNPQTMLPGQSSHGISGGVALNRYILPPKAVADYMKALGMTRVPETMRGSLRSSATPTSKVKTVTPVSPLAVAVPVVSDPTLCGYLK